jgi:RNA polymerase sigma factor (sigma-70 family)
MLLSFFEDFFGEKSLHSNPHGNLSTGNRMDNFTEQELLALLSRPDIEKPVRYLYQRYFDSIVAHVSAHGGSNEDGADIFQESLLVMIDKVRSGLFRGESAVGTFLVGIAKNKWLHESRTRTRRKNRETIYSGSADQEIVLTPGLKQEEAVHGFEKLMRELGDVCRKLLTGFYYEDKSMRELLAEFDYENEQVLRNKKSKCMKRLKEMLQRDQDTLTELQSYY